VGSGVGCSTIGSGVHSAVVGSGCASGCSCATASVGPSDSHQLNLRLCTLILRPGRPGCTTGRLLVVEHELTRTLVGFVAGVCLHTDGQGIIREMLHPKSAAFWSDWL